MCLHILIGIYNFHKQYAKSPTDGTDNDISSLNH